MRPSFLGPLAFVVGLALVCALAPQQRRPIDAPEVAPGQPQARMAFRSQQRLSADGTQPAETWMRAAAQRTRLIRSNPQLRGGVSPADWTFLGPTNVGGRIRALVIHPTNPSIMWIGSCGGGIWKTTNGGTTWVPLDDFLPGLSISTMVIDPTNPNVLYAGTGEGFFETEEGSTNTACIRGAGVFKTTDGGTTWQQLPSTSGPNFYYVNRLAMAPGSPNTLLAACSTGVWRTTNGGVTWSQVLGGEWAYDVDFHPTDATRAVAGLHHEGAWYSTNGGVTWTQSASISGHRTEVTYSRSSPTTVFATVSEANSIRVWRSTNGGVTYSLRAGAGISTYEAYNNAVWVNPTNVNQILYGGVYVYRSNDAGASRTQVFTNVHADVHDFVSHPDYNGTTNTQLFALTDGGLYRINNPAGTNTDVSFYSGIGITQFYGAAVNPISGRIMGGTQDNGTKLFSGNIANWTNSAGGDGGYNATDPTDQNYFYGVIYWALQFRSTNGGTSTSYIYNTANPITDANNSSLCNFINYFVLDPNNVNRMLVCTQRLWRSNNVKAASPDWFVIKPSIAPPARPGKVGGGNAHMNTNPPYNISSVAVAPGNSDIIWVGHNNGELYRTTNGTAANPTWTRMDIAQPLPDRWISRICIDPANSNHVYVSFMGWHDDSVWETTNGGASWNDIASGRLIAASVNVLAIHPTRPGWLYAGTDLGLFTTSDNGATWSTMPTGPGACAIEEITFRDPLTMVIATYGRGMWQASLPAGQDTLDVESVALVTGHSPFGSNTSVLLSDDLRFGGSPDYSTDRSRLPVEVDATMYSPIANPTGLSFTIENSASAGGTSKISLWDYTQSTMVTLDTRPVVAVDATYTVTAPSPLARFVGPNGQVRLRIGFENPTGPRAWIGQVDRISGKVNQ